MTGHSRSVLILPGLGNSTAGHWQTLWQGRRTDTRRVEQSDWNRPTLPAWIAALEAAVLSAREPVVLVAHSLGCLLAVHFARRLATGSGFRDRVAAALLVAPADVDAMPDAGQLAESFGPVPLVRLPFPAIVVASRDDPYLSPQRARHFAEAWGAAWVDAGNAGHINIESGHGVWPEGEVLLESLLERASESSFVGLG